jgi:hypothetical protein
MIFYDGKFFFFALLGGDEGVQVRHRRNAISSPVENWQALRHLLTKSKRESAMVCFSLFVFIFYL